MKLLYSIWKWIGQRALGWISTILFIFQFSFGQIGIGTTTPNSKAILDISATDKGVLIPRLTTLQRNAITSPPNGLLIYNSTVDSFQYWNGVQWVNLVAGADQDWIRVADTLYSSPDSTLTIKPPKVGIGTTVPSAVLDVVDTSTNQVSLIARFSAPNVTGAAGISIESPMSTLLLLNPVSGDTFFISSEPNAWGGNAFLNFNYSGTNPKYGYLMSIDGGGSDTSNLQFFQDTFRVYTSRMIGLDRHEGAIEIGSGYVGMWTKNDIEARSFLWRPDTLYWEMSRNSTLTPDTLDIFSKWGGNNAVVRTGGVVQILPTPADSIGLTINGSMVVGDYNSGLPSPPPGTIRFNSFLNRFEGYDGMTWVPFGSGGGAGFQIIDTDGDTKVQVEKGIGGDEDSIFISTGDAANNSTLYWRLAKGRIEVFNTGGSVFLGKGAGANEDLTNRGNVFIGESSGYNTTSGTWNVCIGYNAGYSNQTGWYNVAIGKDALYNDISGQNVAVGYGALKEKSSGQDNVAVGYMAMFDKQSGTGSVGIGRWAGRQDTTGNYNIFIGFDANPTVGNLQNAIAIGYNAQVECSNCMVLGGTGVNAVKVGIGTSNPTYRLHVAGKIKTDALNETSDIRLKERIEPITGALALIEQIQGVSFYWKQDNPLHQAFPTDKQYGVIAQELEKILPELVDTDKEGYKSVEYTKLIPILIEAIKEQQELIKLQQEELKIYQSQLSQLESQVTQLKEALEVLGLNSASIQVHKETK